MPTPNPIAAENALQNAPLPQRLYDTFMAEIEPDLMSTNVTALAQKYADESPKQHAERMARYQVAYKKFQDRLAGFMKDLLQIIRMGRRSALQKNESTSRGSESVQLSGIEQAFLS
jgi:hypothetical protein